MTTETFSELSTPTNNVLESANNLNHKIKTAVEKLAALQIDSLKTYSKLGTNQIKAAAEVRDIDGLQKLLSLQTDVFREIGGRLLSDFKAILPAGSDAASKSKKVDT